MKKGIAVFYDPHNVYQFLWYYSTYGKDVEWTALCLPNSFSGDQVSSFVEKIGFFKKIIIHSELFEGWSQFRQFKEFFKMFLYAIFFQQERYARNFIKKIIGDTEYDTSVVLTDCGYVSGMFIAESKHKEVIILEDGMGDYIDRKYSNLFKNIKNFYSIKGFVLSLLGYVNFSSRYPLRTTKNCIKFSSHSDKMHYTNYKQMKTLFDMRHTDVKLFTENLNLIYPGLKEYFSESHDLILFTTPLIDYADNAQKYYDNVQKYINERNPKSILIKKHPRDLHKYSFNESIKVTEIPQSIPAEVLLTFLKNIDIYFMELSSTNLYISSFNFKPTFFYHNGLSNEIATIGCSDHYYSKEEFVNRLKYWDFSESQIIDL